MNLKNKKRNRQVGIRRKLIAVSDRPRLSIFRSNKYIYAQIIDDSSSKTLVGASEKMLEKETKLAKDQSSSGRKIDRAKELGMHIAKMAIEKKVKKVVFDRGRYRYHGRVKAFVEGARAGGLEF